MTTNATRPKLTLFGDRPNHNDDTDILEATPTTPAMRNVTDEAVAAIRASFSDKRHKARRKVHIVS